MIHTMFQILFTIVTIYGASTFADCGSWSCLSLFQSNFRSTKKMGSSSSVKMVISSSSEKLSSVSSLPPLPSMQGETPERKALRNLKSVPVKEDGALLARWNELKGLSEKELIVSSSSTIMKAERSEIALGLAYRRCEYVTQLFSKTFYMGTSLMRPDARAHVWAIYAWCRRTDDIVDSPRALLNREVLTRDLEDWSVRLDRIWAGMLHPYIFLYYLYFPHFILFYFTYKISDLHASNSRKKYSVICINKHSTCIK